MIAKAMLWVSGTASLEGSSVSYLKKELLQKNVLQGFSERASQREALPNRPL
jgi:hypothetical protein